MKKLRLLHIFPKPTLKYNKKIYAHMDTSSFLQDMGLTHSYLLGYLLKHAAFPIECRITQVDADKTDVTKLLCDFDPDVVALTAMTYSFHNACAIASKAKEFGAAVIVGGCHISLLPKQLTHDMDIAVLGEGEETYLELINHFHQRKWGPEYWKNVKGVAFKTSLGEIHLTSPRPFIEDLDLIGHPARELAPPTFTVRCATSTSRGCVYRCSFCCETSLWKNRMRFHSPEYVIKEIDTIYKFSKTDRIKFHDPIFPINKRRLMEIVKLWEKHPLYGHIQFYCSARSNLIDDELVKLLKRMNIERVFLGIESQSSKSLEYLKGKEVKPEDNQRACDILTRHKIKVMAGFIIGLPDETEEQILETYQFSKKNRIFSSDTSFLVPAPGTKVWDDALRRNLVSENMDFSKWHGHMTDEDTLLLNNKIPREKMMKLMKMFQALEKRRCAARRLRRTLDFFLNPLLTLKYFRTKFEN